METKYFMKLKYSSWKDLWRKLLLVKLELQIFIVMLGETNFVSIRGKKGNVVLIRK